MMDVDGVRDAEAASARESSSPRGTEYPGCKNLTVCVIVPVHEGGAAFERCLQSIRSSSRMPDEVIVVVDGATDGSAELAGRYGTRVLRTAARSGPAAARNLGARYARSDILFFTDADVALSESAIAEVLEVFRDRPEVSALIGSYDDSPSAGNFLSQYKNLFHHYVHQNAREEGYTFWGAGGAIRRGVFLSAGGYDEAYRCPCIEDIELGYRLKAAGHRIRVSKRLQIKHLKRWNAVSLFRSDFFQRALPWTKLILRTGHFENDLNINLSSRAKVTLVYVLAAMLGLSWWWPWAGLLLAALIGLTLIAMDARLLRFFQQKRGSLFALGTIPWHWFYYSYSGLAFAIGLLSHYLTSGSARPEYEAKWAAQPLLARDRSVTGGLGDEQ
jgi:GT2 family glycosyltransferase